MTIKPVSYTQSPIPHGYRLNLPFVNTLTTRLPKKIAAIRTLSVRILTITGVFALSGSVFRWPIVSVGAAYAMWTVYSQVLRKDLLIHQFKKIAGGKKAFRALPKVDLEQFKGERVYEAALRLNWETLPGRISTSKTLDGRKIVIVKAKDSKTSTKSVLVYVERLSPSDLPRRKSSWFAQAMSQALLKPLHGNTTAIRLDNDIKEYNTNHYLLSSLKGELAKSLKS